ncbi:putative acetyltransferase EpsM [Bacillus sp. J14TS2]|uniref:acetyltransferase n=1 Tax=Bacillus sp. J14TS2 TaxID=2807188 RepID=UPI001AFE03EF|nr:acetyltransferase [Bacillus sp. J14TS2]GIN73220.1 putative acetyltransferase EpsM [Bacillus sp. J14TS2]
MKIVMIGQGGHSKVIYDLVASQPDHEIIASLDDKNQVLERKHGQYIGPIFAFKRMLEMYPEAQFLIAIGNNKVRQLITNRLQLPKNKYVTLIHSTATVSSTARIGYGSVIMAHAVVQADARVGNHTIINTNAVIEHDSQVGDYVHISPSSTLTGNVTVGEGAQVGAGATIIPAIKIGEWSVIGAGATVIHAIPSFSKAVGVPAMIKKDVKKVQ